MAENTADTSSQIIDAARQQFFLHGYEGARLQTIADRIGVTKAMIHYYFNTKQELFERVYAQSVTQLFEGFSDTLEQDIPLFKKIEQLIENCLRVAERDPDVLTFVVTESKRKPEWLKPILDRKITIQLESFDRELESAASSYQIASVDARVLLLQIFSLCYYPVLSETLNESLFATGVEGSSETEGPNRKGIILDTILNWLTA